MPDSLSLLDAFLDALLPGESNHLVKMKGFAVVSVFHDGKRFPSEVAKTREGIVM